MNKRLEEYLTLTLNEEYREDESVIDYVKRHIKGYLVYTLNKEVGEEKAKEIISKLESNESC